MQNIADESKPKTKKEILIEEIKEIERQIEN